MMRVKLKESAPAAYWRHARKQCMRLGTGFGIADVSDEHGKFLLSKGHAKLVEKLPVKAGRTKPLKFGDKVMFILKGKWYRAVINSAVTDTATITYEKDVMTHCDYLARVMQLKRGWD